MGGGGVVQAYYKLRGSCVTTKPQLNFTITVTRSVGDDTEIAFPLPWKSLLVQLTSLQH